jgi:hypothetical protein
MTTPSLSIAKVNGKKYQYLQFSTKSYKDFNTLFEAWYKDGKKQ